MKPEKEDLRVASNGGLTDTPRTDAKVMKILSSLQSGTEDVVYADFARQLERENAEFRKVMAVAQTFIAGHVMSGWRDDELDQRIAALLATAPGGGQDGRTAQEPNGNE